MMVSTFTPTRDCRVGKVGEDPSSKLVWISSRSRLAGVSKRKLRASGDADEGVKLLWEKAGTGRRTEPEPEDRGAAELDGSRKRLAGVCQG